MFKASANLFLVGIVLTLTAQLSAAEPERKDAFGDSLPPGAIARLGTTRFRCSEQDVALSLTVDGQSYVQAEGATLSLRSVKTGQPVRRWENQELADYKGRRNSYSDVRISPDGRHLLALLGETLHTFDLESGKELKAQSLSLERGRRSTQLAYSNDDKRLACVKSDFQDASVAVLDTATGKAVFTAKLPGLDFGNATLSSDGKLLATWGMLRDPEGKRTQVFSVRDVESGKELPEFPLERSGVAAAIFSPDGRSLAAATWNGIVIWDVKSAQTIKRFMAPASRYFSTVLCYSPDGKQLLVAGDSGITRIWNLATGARQICHGPAVIPKSIRFLPNGKILALGQWGVSVCLWEVVSGQVLSSEGIHTHSIDQVVFNRDGHSLVSVAADGVRWWDLTALTDEKATWPERCKKHRGLERDEDRSFEQMLYAVPLPDDTLLRLTSDGLELTEGPTGRLLRILPAHYSTPLLPTTTDGRTLLTQGWERDGVERTQRILIWDLQTGRKLYSAPLPAAETCEVALSTNRHLLAVVANRPKRDKEFGKFLGQDRPRDKLVPAESNWKENSTELLLWDPVAAKELGRHTLGADVFSALAASPDGRLLAYVSADATVGLWDVELQEPLPHLEGKLHPVSDLRELKENDGKRYPFVFDQLAFSPDGRLIAGRPSYSEGFVVWETASGKIRHDWTANQFHVTSLAFSANSKLTATGTSTGSILLWDMAGRRIPTSQPPDKLSGEQLEKLWTTLQSSDAASAFQAMTTLLQAPEQAVALFQERVKPMEGKNLDDKEIARQIVALDDDDFSVREKASEELTRVLRSARFGLGSCPGR